MEVCARPLRSHAAPEGATRRGRHELQPGPEAQRWGLELGVRGVAQSKACTAQGRVVAQGR